MIRLQKRYISRSKLRSGGEKAHEFELLPVLIPTLFFWRIYTNQ